MLSMPYKKFDNQFGATYKKERVFLDADSWTRYQFAMNSFHGQLSSLFSTLYVMDRINNWPWDLFGDLSGEPFFLRLTYFNFKNSAITTLYRLSADNKNSYTLKQFKNEVRRKLGQERFKEIIQNRLEEVAFDEKTREIEYKVRNYRHEWVAHFKGFWPESVAADESPEHSSSIRLSELQDLSTALEFLYQALNFGIEADEVPSQHRLPIFTLPSHQIRKHELSKEMDSTLKGFAERTGIWYAPEQNPIGLYMYTNEKIHRLNSYRTQLGEPEIFLTTKQVKEINSLRRMFGQPDFKALWREQSQ